MRIGRFIPGWARRVAARFVELATPGNETVGTRWVRAPNLARDAEVCRFVSYAPGSEMPPHSLFHARAWAGAGFHVVIVLNTSDFQASPNLQELAFASGILIRENKGYDFGAWASALGQIPAVRTASVVTLANDSMYGPLDTFDRMVDRVREMDADVIGATESLEFGRHFQSFLLFFKPRALNSGAFWKFWAGVRAGGRIIAVYRYELSLLRAMERAGLRCTALFPSSDRRNPTLTRWRSLIDEGLPYLKIALLRDNLFKVDLRGWETVLEDRGYDTTLTTRHC